MVSEEEPNMATSEVPQRADPEQTEGPKKGDKAPATGTRYSAHEIYENVRETAVEELERPVAALLWSALAAGLTIGFSFVGSAYLATLAPEHLHKAAAAAGYPLGFIFVVLARNQLFTENTLEPIIPLLHAPSWGTLRKLLTLWATVLAGNMVGTLVFAALFAWTPIVGEEIQSSLRALAQESTAGGFWLVLYQAVFAGWLIALMAWLIASTRATGAQVALIWLTTAPISAFGFRHSIAGSTEAFYRAMLGFTSWGEAVFDFVVPAVVGNVVGGVLFVALLNHGQVAADKSEETEEPRPPDGDY
jgi:formate/nitrite transporter FocA (FNT family)